MVEVFTALRGAVVLLMALLTGNAEAQVPQMLRSPFPAAGDKFGQTITVDGDWIAAASQGFVPGIGTGHIRMFRRDAGGRWNPDVLLRPWWISPNSHFSRPSVLALRRNQLFVPTAGGIAVWVSDGSNWQPDQSFGISEQWALGVPITYSYMATDGQTVLACLWGQRDARVLAFERDSQGTFVPVLDLRASQFGGLGVNTNNPTSFGSGLYVDGDVMAIGQPLMPRGGVDGVGRLHTFRRIQGTWTFEQTLDHPAAVVYEDSGFGATVTGKGDELFVGCPVDSFLQPGLRVGSVYAYRYTPGLGWQLDSRINVTGATGQLVNGSGLGSELRYVPPTLVVGASGLRAPGVTPQGPAAGKGTLLAFERCGDLWNQRTLMTTPAAWGVWGLGWLRMVDFDGQTVVGAHPQVGFPHPSGAYWMPDAGMALVSEVAPPGPAGVCNEIGRVVCSPAAGAAPGCGCGAAAEPGRGCPNSTGRGARLYCEGAFDQFTIERVRIENLPPGALTLVQVGAPTPTLLPGVVAGSGVSCVGQPLVQRVALADAAGQVRLDELPAPPSGVLYAAFLQPFSVQALYRDTQDPCGAGWNATNGVSFSAGL